MAEELDNAPVLDPEVSAPETEAPAEESQVVELAKTIKSFVEYNVVTDATLIQELVAKAESETEAEVSEEPVVVKYDDELSLDSDLVKSTVYDRSLYEVVYGEDELVDDPSSDPGVEPTDKSVDEPADDPSSDPGQEPTDKSVNEPVDEPADDPSSDPGQEPDPENP